MLLKTDAGWKVWGTMPSNTTAKKGDRVTFDAKITISQDDSKCGFYNRPTKAENDAARA